VCLCLRKKSINAKTSNHYLRLPVFRLHRLFMPAGKVLVFGFLLGILSACTVLNQPDSSLSLHARLETLNDHTEHIYQTFPVISLELQN
jgi:hypothetical protein